MGNGFLDFIHGQSRLQGIFNRGFDARLIALGNGNGNGENGQLWRGEFFCRYRFNGRRILFHLRHGLFKPLHRILFGGTECDMAHRGIFACAMPMFGMGRNPDDISLAYGLLRFTPFLKAPRAFSHNQILPLCMAMPVGKDAGRKMHMGDGNFAIARHKRQAFIMTCPGKVGKIGLLHTLCAHGNILAVHVFSVDCKEWGMKGRQGFAETRGIFRADSYRRLVIVAGQVHKCLPKKVVNLSTACLTYSDFQ